MLGNRLASRDSIAEGVLIVALLVHEHDVNPGAQAEGPDKQAGQHMLCETR